MLLMLGKCKCQHTGHGNLDVNYRMRDTVLGTTVKEKDLGVTISVDMIVSEQLQRVIKILGGLGLKTKLTHIPGRRFTHR